jgi:hypothetical protein
VEDLGRLETREVGEVLERAVRRIDKHLRRHGLLDSSDPDAEHEGVEDKLAASAVSGQVPPAGPQWQRGLSQRRAAPLGYDKLLCASLDGFTLHAVTAMSSSLSRRRSGCEYAPVTGAARRTRTFSAASCVYSSGVASTKLTEPDSPSQFGVCWPEKARPSA